jgi:hypothetical protein
MNREEAKLAESIAESLYRIANLLEKKLDATERDPRGTPHPNGGWCESQQERFGIR